MSTDREIDDMIVTEDDVATVPGGDGGAPLQIPVTVYCVAGVEGQRFLRRAEAVSAARALRRQRQAAERPLHRVVAALRGAVAADGAVAGERLELVARTLNQLLELMGASFRVTGKDLQGGEHDGP
jgi:hypothetical protein